MEEKIKNKKVKEKKGKRVKVPTILQMEAVECGAASLAMILAYYGKNVPLEKMRIECGVSRDGSKASNILKAAKRYGLITKGYRMSPEKLREKQGPFIIHWNFNHFLVVEGFKKDKVYLNDPAVGSRTVSWDEYDQSFTGVVLTFEQGPNFEKGGNKKSIITALRERLKGSNDALAFISLVSLMLVIPGMLIPTFSKVFIDQILLGDKTTWLSILLLGLAITALMRGGLTWLQQYFLLRMETKIALSSSSRYLWHVLRLPMEFFSQRTAGDVSNRVASNDKVASLLSRELATTVLSCVTIVFYFFLMLEYDLVLTLIGVTAVILNMIFLKAISQKRENANMRLLQARGKVIGTAMSGLQIIETLKATGSESDFFAQWGGYQAKLINSEQDMGRSSQYLLAVPQFLSLLTTVVVLIIGANRVLDGYLTMGMLVAFQSLMASFMGPVNSIVNLGSSIQEVKGDMNRLDDVMDYPIDEHTQQNIDTDIEEYDQFKLSGNITIRNLSFGYSPLEGPLIENFSIELKPGQRVALVGESGSGKSTVARLITGLYKPWSGEILFDGKPREEIPRSVFTSSLSFVDQEISIFSGTIRENLTLWDKSILEIDVIRATKDGSIHTDITSRANGYEYQVEEGGRNFSGGQKQRLEIARSLVNNPTIMVMDEATSALDPKTEQEVDKSIRRRGCTCIIVAHRLSTIRDCDEIVVMKEGKIVQRGTHDTLKELDGEYADLIELN